MLESAESRNAPLVDTHETNQNPASVPSHVPTAGTQSRVELSGVVTSLCSNAKEQGQKWITPEGARQIATHVCKVVDDKQFQVLFNFFHDQRILIPFKKLLVLLTQS